MARTIEFYTPEQVAIHYELAGVGSRGLAAGLDASLQLLLYGLLFLIPVAMSNAGILPPIPKWPDTKSGVVCIALLTILVFAVMWGYYVFFETLWNGETPGKRWMGLRVIKDGGYPVDFRSVMIRNLIRVIDSLPLVYSVGFVFVLYHSRYQRLGDMAAGTLVVRHGQEEKARRLTMGNAQVLRLLDAATLTQLSQLTRDEYRMVQRFLERRKDLPVGLQGEFAERLAKQLIEKFAYQEPELGMDYLRWLEELDLAYRRRSLGLLTVQDAPAKVASAPAPAPAPDAATQPPAPSAPEGRRW